MNAKKTTGPLNKAVELAQLYAGSSLGMNVRDAQKLYSRLTRACRSIGHAKGMDERDVLEQVTTQANKLGPKQAVPGQHF